MTFRLAVTAAVLCAVLPWAGPARAYHDLDCGTLRPVVTDPATGRRYCGPVSPDALDQVLRHRRLRQEQDRRVRELRLEHKQRAKAQDLIARRESERRQTDRSHAPDRDRSAPDRRRAVGPRGVLKLPPPIPYRLEDLKKYQ